MKARVHIVVGLVLGVLYSLIFRLSLDQFAPVIIFTGLVSFLIDLDHFAVYMLMYFEKAKKEVLNLDITALLEGMTTHLAGYLYWHTFTIIAWVYLAGFLSVTFRGSARFALIVHWILDLVSQFMKTMRSRRETHYKGLDSKVRNSKYAKESIRRLIEDNKGVFDRLAGEKREEET